MARLKFKDESWDELIPIFAEKDNKLEKIATGVLLNIFDNIFLLTASHVIDQVKNIHGLLKIPTTNGFENITGILYHRYLEENEDRKNDMIDFSYFKLSEEIINVLHNSFKPLTEEMIELSSDFSLELNVPNKIPTVKEAKSRLKDLYDNKTFENIEKVKLFEELIERITITFAGYSNTKTKERNDVYYSEHCYYKAFRVTNDIYESNNCSVENNIIGKFAEKGTMNSDFEELIYPKPEGISGGGIYRLILTEWGIDRKLIGIGHTYKSKKHLFIGTNIFICVLAIKKRLERENILNNERKQ